MITAIVSFPLTPGTTSSQARDLFEGSAPKYRDLAGLVRKYYLYDGDAMTGGGVYLWETRAAAEAVYTPAWKAMIEERYGAAPDIRFFESPVIVDNSFETGDRWNGGADAGAGGGE
ncbi:MAG: monooxygenase [Pseudomonadota bacterium]